MPFLIKFVKHSDLGLEILLSSFPVLLNAHEVKNGGSTAHAEKVNEIVLRGNQNKKKVGGF